MKEQISNHSIHGKQTQRPEWRMDRIWNNPGCKNHGQLLSTITDPDTKIELRKENYSTTLYKIEIHVVGLYKEVRDCIVPSYFRNSKNWRITCHFRRARDKCNTEKLPWTSSTNIQTTSDSYSNFHQTIPAASFRQVRNIPCLIWNWTDMN